jgi:hypothetical protein
MPRILGCGEDAIFRGLGLGLVFFRQDVPIYLINSFYWSIASATPLWKGVAPPPGY